MYMWGFGRALVITISDDPNHSSGFCFANLPLVGSIVRMRRMANAVSVVLLGLIVISAVGAESRRGPTVRPTTGPGSDEFTVEVIEISGLAEVRSDPYSSWQK